MLQLQEQFEFLVLLEGNNAEWFSSNSLINFVLLGY